MVSAAARAGLASAAVAGVAVVAVGLALVSQHRFGMLPCGWCVFQRLVFLVFAALALLAALLPAGVARRGAAGLAAAVAASGVVAAAWQHFVAAKAAQCNFTFADRVIAALGLDARFPDVFMALASCAEASLPLLGVPYAFWSLATFAALAAVMVAVAAGRLR